MPRIRSIKPEIWSDERFSTLDPISRLVFIGLITQADDRGRLVDSVRLLDGAIFPFDDSLSVHGSLIDLSMKGLIERGVTDNGRHIIQIVSFEKHQQIQRPNYNRALPPISSTHNELHDPHRNITEDSLSNSMTNHREISDPFNDPSYTEGEGEGDLKKNLPEGRQKESSAMKRVGPVSDVVPKNDVDDTVSDTHDDAWDDIEHDHDSDAESDPDDPAREIFAVPGSVADEVRNFLRQTSSTWTLKGRTLDAWAQAIEHDQRFSHLSIADEIREAADYHNDAGTEPKAPHRTILNWLKKASSFAEQREQQAARPAPASSNGTHPAMTDAEAEQHKAEMAKLLDMSDEERQERLKAMGAILPTDEP